MAEKEFVFKINGQQAANTINGIQKQIKALDDQIANSNINDPNFGNLVKESDRAKASLKTLQTEGIAGLKPQGIVGQIKNFGSSLAEIPGPIGGVVGGINSMTAASLRFIATPVGAIIAALVLVFKAFQKGIESSEKAQMGLNKIMGAFNGIIGPVIKTVGEFAAMLIDGVVFAIDAVMGALEALGVDFAENARAGMQLADTLNQIEEAEGDLEVARAQQNRTLAEAKELLSDTNATYADRKRALDSIRVSEEKLAAQEVDLARKQVAAAKENIRLYGASKDANDKLDAARIKLANTEEAFAAKKRQFNKEEKKLISEAAAAQKQADADAEARRKEAAAAAKAYREERIKAADDARAILERIALKELEDERNRLINQEKFRADAEKRTVNRSTYNAKEKALLLALIEQEYNDNIKNINKEADEKELKRKEDLQKKLKQLRGENNDIEIEDEGKKYDELVKQVEESYVKKAEIIIDTDETLKKASEDLAARRKKIEISDGEERIKLVEEQQATIKEALSAASDDEVGIASETQTKILTLEEEKAAALAEIEKQRQIALAALQQKFTKDAIDKKVAESDKLYAAQKAAAEKEFSLLEVTAENYDEKKKEFDEKQLENEIANLEKRMEILKEGGAATAEELIAAEQAYYAKVNELRAKDLADEEAKAQKKKDIIKGSYEATLTVASSVMSAIADLQEASMNRELDAAKGNSAKQDAIRKEYFEKNKKVQIANAIISTIQGAVSAFTSLSSIPVVGPVLGGIAAAAALVAGYANVEKIKSTSYQSSQSDSAGGANPSPSKFAEGGLLRGRKHAEGGMATPYGELEGGEYVINREATASFLPLLDRINAMGTGSGTQNNQSAASEFSGTNGNMPIIKTYVVASDVTSQQEANKRISDLARL